MQVENINYEINNIKADEDVFRTLLGKQPHYEVTKETSDILLSNLNSDILITIFTNPHCNPCGRMHKKVNALIAQNKNTCIQYMLSSFNKELDISNKYLIGVYQQKNRYAMHIFDEWFDSGMFNKEEFFRKYPVEKENINVGSEFNKHEQWKEKSGLRATPTILVNGYKLPDNYKIEDLRFISNIEI